MKHFDPLGIKGSFSYQSEPFQSYQSEAFQSYQSEF